MLNPLVVLKVIVFYTLCASCENAYYYWKSIGFRILGYFKIYEKRHFRFLARQISKGSTACDIGAHFGVYSNLFINQVGENGSVFIFEPFPPAYRIISKRFRSRVNCICLPFAISNKHQKDLWLNVPRLCGIVPEPALATVNTQRKDNSDYQIETRTLDSFAHNFNQLSVIKADVEGHELYMLEGALELLSKFRPLVMFEDNNIADNIPRYLNMIESLDYCLCFLDSDNKLELLETNNIPNDYNFYLAPLERLESINRA